MADATPMKISFKLHRRQLCMLHAALLACSALTTYTILLSVYNGPGPTGGRSAHPLDEYPDPISIVTSTALDTTGPVPGHLYYHSDTQTVCLKLHHSYRRLLYP
eukprot:1822839-Pleurochrysis_carterae.AAC.1